MTARKAVVHRKGFLVNLKNSVAHVVGAPLVEGWSVGWPIITEADKRVVRKALEAGDLGLGHSTVVVPGAPERVDYNRLAAERWEQRSGVRPVFCINGSRAISVALEALGIDSGEVVGSYGTWTMGTWGAVVRAGATPVMVDAELRSWGADFDQMQAAIGPRTAGLLYAPMYGGVGELGLLPAIADKAQVASIIDGAHANLATFRGRPLTEYADVVTGSLQSSKGPVTTGEGGSVAARDAALRATIERIVFTGSKVPGARKAMGANERLPRLLAALLWSQLEHVPAEMATREEAWPRLDEVMRRWGWIPQVHEVGGPQYKHASRRDVENDRFEGISTPVLRAALSHLTGAAFEAPYAGAAGDPTWLPELISRTRVKNDREYGEALARTRTERPVWTHLATHGGVWCHEALLNGGFVEVVDGAFERIDGIKDALRALSRTA